MAAVPDVGFRSTKVRADDVALGGERAVIGAGSIVGGGAFITEGSEFPPNSIILGAPAKAVKQRDNTHANRLNAWVYHRNAQAYLRGEHRAWDGEAYERWKRAKLAEIKADADL